MMNKRQAWLFIARMYFDYWNVQTRFVPRVVTNGLCWAVKVMSWQNQITNTLREEMLGELQYVHPTNDFWCARGRRNAHLRSTQALFLAEGMAQWK